MWTAFREKLKGWKTIIWNGVLVFAGLIGTLFLTISQDQVVPFLPDKYKPFAPLLITVIGVIGGGLRLITTGPVGAKGDDAPTSETKAGD